MVLKEEFEAVVVKKEKKVFKMATKLDVDFFGPRDLSCMQLPSTV